MPSAETDNATRWHAVSKYYRRPPGLGWLAGLLLIPLLLGAIGYSLPNRPGTDIEATVPSGAAPSANLPGMSFAPLSIVRAGNDFTISGDVPDEAAKASLLDTLRGVFGPGVNLVDKSTTNSGVNTPASSGLVGLFRAAANIPDFNFDLRGDVVTLTGTAPSGDVRAAVDTAATAALPNTTLANRIRLPSAPGATMSPGAPAQPLPGAAGGEAQCANLAADVAGLLQAPLTFATDGVTLAGGAEQTLTQLAQKVRACPDSRVVVTGYTDDTGNDAINGPLSRNRAQSVADFLISQGVSGDRLTSQGLGSADPVAGNDTAEGRAQNRRVEITVS